MEEMSDYQWVLVPNFCYGNRRMIEQCVFFHKNLSKNHNIEICDHAVFLADKYVVRSTNSQGKEAESKKNNASPPPSPEPKGHGDGQLQNQEPHSPSKRNHSDGKPNEIIIPPNEVMLKVHKFRKDITPSKFSADREYRLAKAKEGTIHHPKAIIWDLPLKIELWKFNLDFSADHPNKEMQSYFE